MHTVSKSNKSKTFTQLYRDTLNAVEQSRIRRQQFLDTVMGVTKKKKSTIRNWGLGIFPPSALEKEVISRELGIPVEELFPPELDPKKKQPTKKP